MVVPATGHQVCYILWVQVAIFNKGVGVFFIWIKILCIEYILWRILTSKFMLDVANMLKIIVKDVLTNNYQLLNIL